MEKPAWVFSDTEAVEDGKGVKGVGSRKVRTTGERRRGLIPGLCHFDGDTDINVILSPSFKLSTIS